jgi:hypothetical protein
MMDGDVKEVCPGTFVRALPHAMHSVYLVSWYAPWRVRVYRRCWDCDLREFVGTYYIWQRND